MSSSLSFVRSRIDPGRVKRPVIGGRRVFEDLWVEPRAVVGPQIIDAHRGSVGRKRPALFLCVRVLKSRREAFEPGLRALFVEVSHDDDVCPLGVEVHGEVHEGLGLSGAFLRAMGQVGGQEVDASVGGVEVDVGQPPGFVDGLGEGVEVVEVDGVT